MLNMALLSRIKRAVRVLAGRYEGISRLLERLYNRDVSLCAAAAQEESLHQDMSARQEERVCRHDVALS